ncbi:MAG: PAS domain-containing sensor histidine kinase, partial [Candidatus Obscuribacterales bacterium]|nr:PAS domain-containing sensor histidine kinase [Candidatus Obscuribacterales bacterium]
NQSESDSRFMEERAKNLNTLRDWLWYGIGLNIILAAGICLAFSIDFVRRIKHLTENSLRLSKGRQLLPALAGSDEIAQLDGLFHRVGTIFRQSFERETSMFDSAADLIVCLDNTGKIERINRVFSESLSYDPNTSVGTEIYNYILQEDREQMRSFLDTAKKGGPSEDIELRMLTSAGEILDYQWAVHWEPGYDSFYCVAHDTTERNRLEQAKQDFVAMLSHDLRSPLTALSITIDLVTQGASQKLPDKCIELFKLSEKSVARLITLISELLDLEKMEAGEMEIVINAVPISRIVSASIEALEATASAKGVKLISVTTDDLVAVDEQRLSRALINLVSNAIKYSSKDSEVRIEAKKVQAMVEVRVTDFGPGIQPHYLRQIFDRYKQIEDSQNIHQQGTGLGLSIFKAILDAHGGITGVESTVGKGSTFWFRVKGCDS